MLCSITGNLLYNKRSCFLETAIGSIKIKHKVASWSSWHLIQPLVIVMAEDLQLSAATLAALKEFASSRGILSEEDTEGEDVVSRVRRYPLII